MCDSARLLRLSRVSPKTIKPFEAVRCIEKQFLLSPLCCGLKFRSEPLFFSLLGSHSFNHQLLFLRNSSGIFSLDLHFTVFLLNLLRHARLPRALQFGCSEISRLPASVVFPLPCAKCQRAASLQLVVSPLPPFVRLEYHLAPCVLEATGPRTLLAQLENDRFRLERDGGGVVDTSPTMALSRRN